MAAAPAEPVVEPAAVSRSVAAVAGLAVTGQAVAVTGQVVAAVAGRVAPPVPMTAAVARVAQRAWPVGARYPALDGPYFPMADPALRTKEPPSPEVTTE